MATTLRIVTLGDSVPWGQGLPEEKRYDVLVREALRPKFPDISLEHIAHSGAVIGAQGASGGVADGEVPVPRPTIIEQCDAFTNAPETVDLLLLNGGINDVGVARILNPFAIVPSLSARIRQACHDGMLTLLRKVSARFSKPSCRILVTGYYIVLSDQSDPLKIGRLLSLYGIARPPFSEIKSEVDFFNPILDRCLRFFSESTAQLRQAILEAGDPRIVFVPSGFTADNAVFAPNALLWGLNEQLGPEDPVAAERQIQCDLVHPPSDILGRIGCDRASAGHPNIAGAVQYARQLLAVLP